MSKPPDPTHSLVAARQALEAHARDLETQAATWRLNAQTLNEALQDKGGAWCLLRPERDGAGQLADFQVTDAGEGMLALAGQPGQALIGRKVGADLAGPAWPSVAALASAFHAQSMHEEGLRIGQGGGSIACIRSITVLPDGVAVIWRNIIARTAGSQTPLDADNWFRSTIEFLPCMVVALDERKNIIVWNRCCERVSGYRADEVIMNRDAMRLLYPGADYRARMLQEWKARGNEYDGWEWTLRTKAGKDVVVAWHSNYGRYPIAGWNSWAVGNEVAHGAAAALSSAALDSYWAALKVLPTAVLLVAAPGLLLQANAAAQALLRTGDGLKVVQERLRGAAPGVNARLDALFAQVFSLPGGGAGGWISIPREDKRPLLAVVRPLALQPDGAPGAPPAAAVIYLDDPDAELPNPHGLLESMFGLTFAEARVAVQLAGGHLPTEVAAKAGTSIKTVRTQMAAVFEKLGVRRQSQLVAVVQRVLLAARIQAA